MDEVTFEDSINIDVHEIGEKPSHLETFQLVQVEPGESPQDNSDVIFDLEALQELLSTLSHDPRREQGAFLSGEYGVDNTTGRRFTHVTDSVIIPVDIVSTRVSTFNFSHEADTYAQIERDKYNQRNGTKYGMVGLAHSHPNLGVFISGGTADGSGGDDNLHAQFSQPGEISVIFDPVKKELAVYSKDGTAREGAKLNHVQPVQLGRLGVNTINPVEKTGRGVSGAHGMRLHKQIFISNAPPQQHITVEV